MKRNCLFSLIVVFSFLQLNAQSTIAQDRIKKKKIVQKIMDLTPFNQFDLKINKANVFLKRGLEQKVEIKGQPEIIDRINTEVVDGEWVISLDESVKKHKYLSIYITVADLKGLTLSSSGQIVSTSEFRSAHNLIVNLTGIGMIRLSGRAQSIVVNNIGLGTIDLTNFKSVDCTVNIFGRGICKVNPMDLLTTNVAGGGQIIYKSVR